MTTTLSKADLRDLVAMLDRRAQDALAPRAPSAAELVRASELKERLAAMMAEAARAPERGRQVLSWRLPRDLVPTQNDLRGIKPWRLKKIKAALHTSLMAALPAWPEALTNGSTRRRWARTTRFSPKEPDEMSCDGTGFKVALDVMTDCGVIADDDRAHLYREPRWEKCKPGETQGLVELFLIADERVEAAAPAFVRVEQLTYEPGLFTKAIKEGA